MKKFYTLLILTFTLYLTANAQNVGIGTTNPQSKLDVEGGLTIGATYSGTNASPANGAIIEGNVGIGTTSPTNELDVAGATPIISTTDNDHPATSNSMYGAIGFQGSGGTLASLIAVPVGNNDLTLKNNMSGGGIRFQTDGANDRMRINSSGAVTINNLSGSGNRMIIANSSGQLSTQAIPVNTDDQDLSLSGNTLSITGGNSVNLSSVGGDNLGNHTATTDLEMSENDIYRVNHLNWENSGEWFNAAVNGNGQLEFRPDVQTGGTPLMTLDDDGDGVTISYDDSGNKVTPLTIANESNTISSASEIEFEGGTTRYGAFENRITSAVDDNADFFWHLSDDGAMQERMWLRHDGRLTIDGAMVVGDNNTGSIMPGGIRWNGTNFQGNTGSSWVNFDMGGAAADNLGNHTATQNIETGNFYISRDGDDEGLYIESDGNVSIGDNDAGIAPLVVVNDQAWALGGNDDNVDNLYLENFRGGGLGNLGGSISFSGPANGGANDQRRHAVIAGVQTDASETDYVGMAFFTHNGTVSTDDVQESMRLTHDGKLGIGVTEPDERVHIQANATSAFVKFTNDVDDVMVIGSEDLGGGESRSWFAPSGGGSIDFTKEFGYNPNLAGSNGAWYFESGLYIDDLSGSGTRMVTADANGQLSTQAIPSGGDNLGNHTATQNIELNGNWLSNDGGSEGININNTGEVGIGATPNSNKALFAQNTASSNNGTSGIRGEVTGNGGTSNTNYGVQGVATGHTDGGWYYGVYGNAARSTANSSGRAYGVYGQAGNVTDGWNYGVYGRLTGSNQGAAIYGSINGDQDVNGTWAGFFDGDVNLEDGLAIDGNKGSSGQVLTTDGTNVYWDTPSGGGSGGADGIQNVNCGTISSCSSTITSYPYNESFAGGGFGGWTQPGGDDGDFWDDSDNSSSTSTGTDNAADGDGNFLYIETSSPVNSGDFAYLESPCFDLTNMANEPMLTFYYHMYGDNIGSLDLQASTDGTTWATLWSQSDEQHTSETDSYHKAFVRLLPYAGCSVKLRFVATNGTSGTSYRGDIAIDDITIE